MVVILVCAVSLLGSFFVAVPVLAGRLTKQNRGNAGRRTESNPPDYWDPSWDDPPPSYQE